MRHAACEHLLQQHVCGNTISCGMRHASTCCSNMYVAIQYHVAWGMRAPAAATCMWQYNIMWNAAREHLLQQSLLGALP